MRPTAGAAATFDADALLDEYGLPGSAPAEQLRAITRVAATVAGVPTAVVNLHDGCFQYAVGEVGFVGVTSPVEDSMCTVAMRDARLRYVPDARLEPVFAGNPWVDGTLAGIRLYASAPMTLPDGRLLGSLCVFDDQPRSLSPAQLDALVDLAAQAVTVFEQTRLTRESAERAEDARLAHEQAERQGALTAAVLDTIDVGVVACDADGRLTRFNRAARQFHGMSEDPSVVAPSWAEQYSLYAEDGTTPLGTLDVPLVLALVDGVVHDLTIVIAPHGQPPRTVRCDGQAMVGPTGQLLGAVVALQDVTQARDQERELIEARDQALGATRAKTAFLAAASHEIRTPLNGVLGMLEVLSTSALTGRQQEYVAVARASGEALLHLLNDVLDLSKAEATTVTLAAEPFGPADLAADVATALRATAVRKGLLVEVHTLGQQELVGDAGRLRQVLVNLVGNAVTFTDRGRVDVDVEVCAGADAERSRLRIAVRDTGPGMSVAEVEQLFQPFVQGAQGGRCGGTGLGMSLTHQLVELMGGRLQVASTLGSGSTFTVELHLPAAPPAYPPVVDDDEHPTEADRDVGPAPARPRVLVADDNDVNLLVARALLAAEGAEVVTVEDGDDAVAAVRDGSFDLVLLDVQMPRMSGMAAARAIRALPGAAGRTRLLALTADSAVSCETACLDSGMQGVLVKPVRRADLRLALAGAGSPVPA